MNAVERTALLMHRDTIVQSVDFVYIKDILIAKAVINNEELEEIDYEKTRSAKVRKLLDLLPKKGPKTFHKFVTILKRDYDWLSELLGKFSNTDIPDGYCQELETVKNSCDSVDCLATVLQESLIASGIPFPPTHLIPRQLKISQLRQCLKEMSPGQFVVLHGMAGSGKSVLASESVRSIEIMINSFENNIFWLTIGQTDKDILLTKMQALCERLDSTVQPPLSIDQATERLRRLMMDPRRKNSLIILDDVWRGEVVRAFDFGSKILLTTRDASITDVAQGRALLIKVQDGFTQEESMTYLANCLQISEQDLPEQANQIYFESKGSPMVLSLLAPLLAERRGPQRIDPHRWDHYVGKLRDRKYTQMRRQGSYNYATITEAIAISFDQLDADTRQYFNDFVIFLDDVNIPSSVLEVLWGTSRYETEERMALLISKSLIAQHAEEHSYTVLYGIHDLLLDYLKSKLSPEYQKLAHRKLVDAYLNNCQKNYGALPNDNYIFWFLSYHIYKAEYTHLFQEIYLNLDFISAKLRATGPSDLLNDFRKYEDYIKGSSEENLLRMEDYTRFIRTNGHLLFQCPQFDIIQLGLLQSKSSYVYQDALSTAKDTKHQIYFECCNSIGTGKELRHNQILRSTVLNYGHVTAACFTGDGQRLLSAIGDNQIRMWDVDSGKELELFTGHNGSVHHLSLSWDSKRLVSCSADGTVKVWNLELVTNKLDGTVEPPKFNPPLNPRTLIGDSSTRPNKTPSPRMRQDAWHNMFDVSGRVLTDISQTTYSGHTNEVLCAEFSYNGALIVSCGMDRTARVWMSVAAMELGVLKHPESVNTCCFSSDGSFIATGCTDSTIRIWSALRFACVREFQDQSSRVLFVSFLSDTSLISVSDTEVLSWKWNHPNDEPEGDPCFSVSTIGSANGNCCFQCAAFAQNLLAVATSKDNILLFNIEQEAQILELIGHTGTITCLHFSPNANEIKPANWLLSGSLDETIMVWNVNIDPVKDYSLSNTAFYAAWSKDRPSDYFIASAGSDNRIQILDGKSDQAIFKTEEEPQDTIELCVISHDATMVAWSLLSGKVKLLSLRSNLVKTLGQHLEASPNLLKFSPKDVLIVSCSPDGSIKIWQPNDKCVTISGPKKKVIDCYFVDNEESLLTCACDGSIRLWNVKNGELVLILLQSLGFNLICVDHTLDGLWFAQGTVDHGLQLVTIRLESRQALRRSTGLSVQKSPVRCCRFAGHIQYIAAGYDNGLIEVFNYSRNILVATLETHQSWVRDLQFVSQSPFYQLVSIGDRIAWWDLNRTRSNSLTSNSRSVTNGNHLDLGSHHWRCIRKTNPGLVQTMEFQGRFASRIFASQDGQVVLTVTDSGILYALRQLVDF